MSQALFGLIGVVVGALLTWFREVWSNQRMRERSARYLAIRVVCILDKYVDDCTAVALDDGLWQGQPNAKGCAEEQVSTPLPPTFPQDLDWKSIDHQLMYRLLSLSSQAEAANRMISFSGEVAAPPDYEEYFETRQSQYASLGLTTATLTSEVREKYRIPARDLGDWSPVEQLKATQKRFEELQRNRIEQSKIAPVL